MTDIVTQTNQVVLDNADPNTFSDAARKVALGKVLLALTTEESDTGTVPASPFQIELDKLPIPGTLRIASNAAVVSEYVGASAVAATQYKTSIADGVMTITFHSGVEGETYVAKYLSLDDVGPNSDTALGTILAADFEGSNPQ